MHKGVQFEIPKIYAYKVRAGTLLRGLPDGSPQ